ncbi:hypothetical protein KSP39_PZI004515 [Platanthera zijinensis]|uniref:Uncharacterized protein n=1 Tax=Platanthera zijinensis TaxID=2320716 RepID=A0AAP0BVQ4_9ASPA
MEHARRCVTKPSLLTNRDTRSDITVHSTCRTQHPPSPRNALGPKNLTLFKSLAITFSTVTLFAGVPLYGSSLLYAGPASLVWGWLVVSFFTWFVGMALAEICSSFPGSRASCRTTPWWLGGAAVSVGDAGSCRQRVPPPFLDRRRCHSSLPWSSSPPAFLTRTSSPPKGRRRRQFLAPRPPSSSFLNATFTIVALTTQHHGRRCRLLPTPRPSPSSPNATAAAVFSQCHNRRRLLPMSRSPPSSSGLRHHRRPHPTLVGLRHHDQSLPLSSRSPPPFCRPSPPAGSLAIANPSSFDHVPAISSIGCLGNHPRNRLHDHPYNEIMDCQI